MGVLNYIEIPNNVGPGQSSGFSNSNIKVGMVADFILNNYSLAVLISDNNPTSSVARVINIKVGNFTIRITGQQQAINSLDGTTLMQLIGEGFTAISYSFRSGTMSIFLNPDVFVLLSHPYINTPFILLRNGTFNYYNNIMRDFNNIQRYVDLLSGGYTSKTPNGKFRILQPSFTEEGDYISPYIYSITDNQLLLLTVSKINVTYLSDENNNIWCTYLNLLFK